MLLPMLPRPATEAVLQIAPWDAFSAGIAALLHRNGPIRLVLRMLLQNSSVIASSRDSSIGSGVPGPAGPALFRRQSGRRSASPAVGTPRPRLPRVRKPPPAARNLLPPPPQTLSPAA